MSECLVSPLLLDISTRVTCINTSLTNSDDPYLVSPVQILWQSLVYSTCDVLFCCNAYYTKHISNMYLIIGVCAWRCERCKQSEQGRPCCRQPICRRRRPFPALIFLAVLDSTLKTQTIMSGQTLSSFLVAVSFQCCLLGP